MHVEHKLYFFLNLCMHSHKQACKAHVFSFLFNKALLKSQDPSQNDPWIKFQLKNSPKPNFNKRLFKIHLFEQKSRTNISN